MKELEEYSVSQIYCVEKGEPAKFRIPIYQRNYAWGQDEIRTFIQDVSDSMLARKPKYYIGTLITYKRADNIFEVVDGQQRLTTIYLILKALKTNEVKNVLTYSARKAATYTLAHLSDSEEESDQAIKQGYDIIRQVVDDIITAKDGFKNYFLNNVRLVHFQVPKDVDLNHYFEVMNSRGEQLEKHEIIKARLLEKLMDDKDSMARFSRIWEVCSSMNIYVQQKLGAKKGGLFNEENGRKNFVLKSFDDFPDVSDIGGGRKSISDFLNSTESQNNVQEDSDSDDKFQPIIDFPNLLLIALKITKITENGNNPSNVILDDKELLSEFDKANLSTECVKFFAYNLLKAKFYLDNYIVHRQIGEEWGKGNPWELQLYSECENLTEDDKKKRQELVHLLSMFEVTFSANRHKNYLLYCLLHLFKDNDPDNYLSFLRKLADKYFCDVYLNAEKHAENKQQKSNSFDEVVLPNGTLKVELNNKEYDFDNIYAKGFAKIPLFVFNYTDYKLWRKYADEIRGKGSDDPERKKFFDELGCGDFGLPVFNDFYFSSTRNSLEHFFAQANVDEKTITTEDINCFGNLAMIGSDANSAGSNWRPAQKVITYADENKINKVSVASLKFRIMLQMCKDNGREERHSGSEWNTEDMQTHQTKMLKIIMPRLPTS